MSRPSTTHIADGQPIGHTLARDGLGCRAAIQLNVPAESLRRLARDLRRVEKRIRTTRNAHPACGFLLRNGATA